MSLQLGHSVVRPIGVYWLHIVQKLMPQTSSENHQSAQRKVLVLAYYRSGSTLTGQLFNYNPSAFYWFEPLSGVTQQWGWYGDMIPPRNWYHFDNGTEMYVDQHSVSTDTTIEQIMTNLAAVGRNG